MSHQKTINLCSRRCINIIYAVAHVAHRVDWFHLFPDAGCNVPKLEIPSWQVVPRTGEIYDGHYGERESGRAADSDLTNAYNARKRKDINGFLAKQTRIFPGYKKPVNSYLNETNNRHRTPLYYNYIAKLFSRLWTVTAHARLGKNYIYGIKKEQFW